MINLLLNINIILIISYTKLYLKKQMIESLLTFFCGKNSTKKRKVMRILDGIKYNSETKEYTCPSSMNPDKKYIVLYSTKAFEWRCDCEASIWYQYRTYESPEQRNSFRNQKRCVHIISAMISEFLRES